MQPPPESRSPVPTGSWRVCFLADADAAYTPASPAPAGKKVLPLAEACAAGEHGPDPEQRFVKLRAFCEASVEVVGSAGEADVVVYPHGHLGQPAADAAMRAAADAGRPFVALRPSDLQHPIDRPHGTYWRDSILKSRITPAERAMPAMTPDLQADAPAAHEPEPAVAFCGYVGTALQRLAYRLTLRRRKVLGLSLRERSLRTLEAAEGVRTDFVRRTQFWAGRYAATPEEQEATRRRVRETFWANMDGSPYTFCTRGAGNFSYRLYEVFARGRVPLFLDTDAALPFADEIDYAAHMPIATSIADLPGALRRFHEAHTPESFADLQRANRRLWEAYFEPAAFHARLLHAAVARG